MTIVFFISAFIKVNAVKVQLLKLYQFFFDKLEILDENHDCKLIYLFHTSDLDVFIYLLMTYIILSLSIFFDDLYNNIIYYIYLC